ncbi:MAG TPA: MFS transporter [Solirubrobacteraceae bacterium]|nr:MFS transporter [Solirubrobacteraceae bacterium]
MPSPLRSPRLRRILAAYTINRLGNWIGYVALSLAVFDHTHSALAVSAVLVAGQALPAFLVPAVVARIESSRRRSTLSGLYFFEALATAGLAVLLWHFWLPALLLLAAVDGTAGLAASALLRAELARSARIQVETELAAAAGEPGTAFRVASALEGGAAPGASAAPLIPAVEAMPAALPAQPPRAEGVAAEGPAAEAIHEAERKANAALNIAFSVTFVLGPAIGGAMVAAAGASAALFIDVGSFLVCGALLVGLYPHIEEGAETSVRARLRAAWRHINEAPSLRALLLVEAVALVFAESAGPVEVAYAKVTLQVGDGGFGLLVGSWGAGAVLGSVVFARSLSRPLGVLLSTGTLAVGLAYVGFAVAPSLWFACGAALIGGVGNGVELPSLTSIVQRLTPKHLHARMMAAVESIVALCVAVGLPLGGALVALTSPRAAFAVVGLGAAATTPLLLMLSLRGAAAAERSEQPAASGRPAQQPGSS